MQIIMKKIILFAIFTISITLSYAQISIKATTLLDSVFVWNEKKVSEVQIKKFMKPYYSEKKMGDGVFIATKLGNGEQIAGLFFEKADRSIDSYRRSLILFPNTFSQACQLVNDIAMYYHSKLPLLGYKTKLPVESHNIGTIFMRNMEGGKTSIQLIAMKEHPQYELPVFSLLCITK